MWISRDYFKTKKIETTRPLIGSQSLFAGMLTEANIRGGHATGFCFNR